MKRAAVGFALLLCGCLTDQQAAELRSTGITSAQTRRAQLTAQIVELERIRRFQLFDGSKVALEQAIEDRRAELHWLERIGL